MCALYILVQSFYCEQVDSDQLFHDYTVGSGKVTIKGWRIFCTFCIDFLSENSNADHFEVICCFACHIQSLIDFCVKEKRTGQMHFFFDASLIRSAINRYCCTVIWEL